MKAKERYKSITVFYWPTQKSDWCEMLFTCYSQRHFLDLLSLFCQWYIAITFKIDRKRRKNFAVAKYFQVFSKEKLRLEKSIIFNEMPLKAPQMVLVTFIHWFALFQNRVLDCWHPDWRSRSQANFNESCLENFSRKINTCHCERKKERKKTWIDRKKIWEKKEGNFTERKKTYENLLKTVKKKWDKKEVL